MRESVLRTSPVLNAIPITQVLVVDVELEIESVSLYIAR